MSSLSKARVILIEGVKPHPYADKLDIIEVDGQNVISQKGNWNVGDLAVYVPCGLVNAANHPLLNFIGDNKQIKASKLRGVMSYGVLIPNESAAPIGADLTETLGLVRYEDWLSKNTSHTSPSPNGGVGYTDIESLKKYHSVFNADEDVLITEKLDGCCSSFIYQNGKLYCRTRKRWIAEDNSHWWQIAKKYNLAERLSHFENLQFFGEIYGNINILKYNFKTEGNQFALFDIYNIVTERYLNYGEFLDVFTRLDRTVDDESQAIYTAPVLYTGPYPGLGWIKEQVEEDSVLYNGVREGVVVKPIIERRDDSIGRVILKLHSDRFNLIH